MGAEKKPGQKGFIFWWQTQLLESGLSSTQKLVGMALSTWADSQFGTKAHPGEQLLMERCSLKDRAVRDALKALRETGWIVRTFHAKSKGLKLADEYGLIVPARSSATEVPASDAKVPAPRAGSTGTTCRPSSHGSSPKHPSANKLAGSAQAPTATEDQKWKTAKSRAAAFIAEDSDNTDDILDALFEGGLDEYEMREALGMLSNGSNPIVVFNAIAARRRGERTPRTTPGGESPDPVVDIPPPDPWTPSPEPQPEFVGTFADLLPALE